LHVKSQVVPLQVAVALAGGLHGVHEDPQVAVLELSTHCPVQTWNPPLH
jgi:hypothetical protein